MDSLHSQTFPSNPLSQPKASKTARPPQNNIAGGSVSICSGSPSSKQNLVIPPNLVSTRAHADEVESDDNDLPPLEDLLKQVRLRKPQKGREDYHPAPGLSLNPIELSDNSDSEDGQNGEDGKNDVQNDDANLSSPPHDVQECPLFDKQTTQLRATIPTQPNARAFRASSPTTPERGDEKPTTNTASLPDTHQVDVPVAKVSGDVASEVVPRPKRRRATNQPPANIQATSQPSKSAAFPDSMGVDGRSYNGHMGFVIMPLFIPLTALSCIGQISSSQNSSQNSSQKSCKCCGEDSISKNLGDGTDADDGPSRKKPKPAPEPTTVKSLNILDTEDNSITSLIPSSRPGPKKPTKRALKKSASWKQPQKEASHCLVSSQHPKEQRRTTRSGRVIKPTRWSGSN